MLLLLLLSVLLRALCGHVTLQLVLNVCSFDGGGFYQCHCKHTAQHHDNNEL
jgi:hypothetical protein